MDEGIQGEVAHAHDTEEQPRKRTRLSSQLVREVGLMRNVPGDNHPGFVGSASGIFFIRSVYAALRRSQTSVHFQGETPGSEVVPGEDDHITSIVPGGSNTLWRSGELQATTSAVTFEELVEWTGSFFANWHPFFPFLHAPTVLQYFEVLSHEGVSNEDSSFNLEIVIVKSAISVSLADGRQAGQGNLQVPSNLIFKSYEAAIDSLQHVFSEPTSELGLQAAISVQLFLVSMLRLNAASRLGGLINRMAAQLGLHRCPARYSTFASNEKDIRRRIFWSLYAIDRFICQSMGLPLGLNDDDIDVCFPSKENHIAERPQQALDTKLALMGFLARQFRLRGDIIELRNKSLQYVQKNPDQAISIGAQLTQWWNDIEEYSDAAGTGTLPQYQMTILTLLKHESVISLHRPVLAAAQKGPAYDAALQLCIGSARSIITTLHKAISGSNATIALLWPSCTWAVWISTFILFYAANSRHLSSDIVARLADRSLEILQHLAKRGSAWPEASAAAIRDLRMKLMDPERATFRDGNNSQFQTHDGMPMPTASITEATIAGQSSDPQSADYGLPTENWNEVSGREKAPSANSGATTAPQFVQPMQPPSAFDHEHNSNISFDTAFFNNSNSGFEDILHNMGDGTDVPSHNILDPFSGFDIPFWFDQDQQWDIFQDFN